MGMSQFLIQFALNTSYSKDSRFWTKIVDKIPFIETKKYLIKILFNDKCLFYSWSSKNPINVDETGTSYIDDFENTQSAIDIRSTSWSLSSTPVEIPIIQMDIFRR